MGGDIPPTLPPAPDDPVGSSFASRMWPRRRTRDGSPWRPGTSIARLGDLSVVGEKLVASTNVTQWQAPGDLSTPGAFVGTSRAILQRWRPADLAHRFTYIDCSFDHEER